MTERVEVLIIGGGIAGLSLAMHLAEAGQGGILLLDREAQPGFYASGHNAAIGRSLTGRAEHTALTLRGMAGLRAAGLLAPQGGLLLGAEAGALDDLAAEGARFGVPLRRNPGPGFSHLEAVEHLELPEDGVIDIDGLLRLCRERATAAGAVLRYGCGVEKLQGGREGFEVRTAAGSITARSLVNAAGAWAGALGRMAGGLDLALRPMRRHLVWSPCSWPAPAPWAWWADCPLYLRPESGGLLLCPCDEAESLPPGPGIQPAVDLEVLQGLGTSLRELAPSLAELPVARIWSGLRTFSPDRRFLLGWDPVNPALFWVAGLGGHGMTSGLAVGAEAARAFLHRDRVPGLDPSRFA